MTSPGVMKLQDVEIPEIVNPTDVLLKIEAIGICGSDIHVFYGEHPSTPYPVVQGHEYCGTVVAIGSEVKKVKEGMFVTARPQLVCGKCGPCKRGQYNVCQELKVEGFQAPGVAQDYFIVSEDRIAVLPDSFTKEQGAMVEPVAVAAHATRRLPDLKGKNVVVSGAGTIGNLVAQFAKARGAKKVIISDLSSYRLNIAKKCGIEHVLDLSSTSFEKGIKDILGDEVFQVGFEAAGVQASLEALVANVEKGGDIVIIGVYAKNPVVNMFHVGEHELQIYGTLMYTHEDYEKAIDMIAEGKIILSPLVSKHFPFEQYYDAYKYIERNRDTAMKVIIDL